jgi:hypothetical protein
VRLIREAGVGGNRAQAIGTSGDAQPGRARS